MSFVPPPLRGQVFMVDIGYGVKPWLVVSSNGRNRALNTVLAARLTTTAKAPIPSIVELTPADGQFVGRVLCDDLEQIYRDGLGSARGALSVATMRRVDAGLRVALAL